MARLGGNQAQAVFALLYEMAMVDGDYSENLLRVLNPVFGDSWTKSLQTKGSFWGDKAVEMVKSFPLEKRKEVAACLAAVAALDGKIEAAEKRYWERVKKDCNLPDWSIREALAHFKEISK